MVSIVISILKKFKTINVKCNWLILKISGLAFNRFKKKISGSAISRSVIEIIIENKNSDFQSDTGVK
jgi:hypothetical protein